MSQENVEQIERFFELYNRREIDAWVEMLAPDLEWHIDPEDPDTTVHRGPEAVKRYVLYWAEMIDATVEVREIFEANDDQTVAWTRVETRGELSGAAAGQDLAYIFKLRDGLVVRVQETQDKREALEAVGLSERAMSQENVELYSQAIDAFNRRDLDAFLDLMDVDVEAAPRLASVEGTFHGHEGVRRWWQNLLDAFPDYAVEIVEVHDLGEIIVAAVRTRGHGAGSETPLDQVMWQVGRWRQGKCVWRETFETKADALEAVGLSE